MRMIAMWGLCCCGLACVDSPVLGPAADTAVDAGEWWPDDVGPRRPAPALAAADGGRLPPPTARQLDAAVGAGGAGGNQARASPAGSLDAAADGGETPPVVRGVMPAEGVTARPSRRAALVITELMIDPRARSDTEGEWFELHNPGDRELDVYGCTLADGSAQSRVLSDHLPIAPRSYVAVARGEQPGFKPDLVTSFSLKNGADLLELVCDGVSIDRVAYDKAQGFPVAAGVAMSLDAASAAAGENDLPGHWCLATRDYGGDLGSPAQPNPPCQGAADDAGAGE